MTNTTRVLLEPVFVLHSRPYRNSSLIVELFTMRYGRVAAVARSARGPRSRYQGRLQLFSPLLVSWSGRTDLKNLNHMEPQGQSYWLEGDALLCGFYLNELLMKLLRHEDPYPELYQRYQTILSLLELERQFEPSLRYFERQLLQDIGYGLPLKHDVATGQAIIGEHYYRYVVERGFVASEPSNDVFVFPGNVLKKLSEETLATAEELRFAKRLMRMALARHLGNKPLQSRKLMV